MPASPSPRKDRGRSRDRDRRDKDEHKGKRDEERHPQKEKSRRQDDSNQKEKKKKEHNKTRSRSPRRRSHSKDKYRTPVNKRRSTSATREDTKHKKEPQLPALSSKHKKSKKHRPRSSSSSSSSQSRTHHNGPQPEDKTNIGLVYDLTKDIHPSFTPTAEFLDIKEVKGLALQKYVRDTPTSRKFNIQGKDIRTIRIVDMAYMGIQNWYLRAISAGRFVNVEFTRSIKESQYISRLLKLMRPQYEKGKRLDAAVFDLEIIGAAYATNKSLPFGTDEEKKQVYSALADYTFQMLMDFIPSTDKEKMADRIKQLEDENAALKKDKPDQPEKQTKAKKKGLEKYFGKDKDEDQDDEKEDSGDEAGVLQPISRPAKGTKFLKKHHPKGIKPKDVEEFMKQLALTPAAKAKIDKMNNDTYRDFMAQPVADRTGVREMATDWGLPVDMASKMDFKQLIRLGAIATHRH